MRIVGGKEAKKVTQVPAQGNSEARKEENPYPMTGKPLVSIHWITAQCVAKELWEMGENAM